MIQLYDYELSGNCYKIRLLLTMLDVGFEVVHVDFHPGREHKSRAFLHGVNPVGQIPVIKDGDYVLRDAQAILVYLASQYDPEKRWFPEDAKTRGNIALWLSVADEITRTASAARLHDTLGYKSIDAPACRTAAHSLFRTLDDHLSIVTAGGQNWLAAGHPTIADIACFPYVALARDGGILLDDYPAIRQWIERVRRLPRFVGMSGIFQAVV